jgi:hypothetical protein
MDFKNCLGIIASVSIFARSSGTAIEVNVLNFCIVLTEIENKLANTSSDYNTWTLEHIAPYHITSEWAEYYQGQYQQYVFMLQVLTACCDSHS